MDRRLRELQRVYETTGDLEAGHRYVLLLFSLASHSVLNFCLRLLQLTEMRLYYDGPLRLVGVNGEYFTHGRSFSFKGFYHPKKTSLIVSGLRRVSLHIRTSLRPIGSVPYPEGSHEYLIANSELVSATLYMHPEYADPGNDSISGGIDFRGGYDVMESPLVRADVDVPFILRPGTLRQRRRRTLFAYGDIKQRIHYYHHPEELLEIMAQMMQKPEDSISNALHLAKGHVWTAADMMGMPLSDFSKQMRDAGLEELARQLRIKKRDNNG